MAVPLIRQVELGEVPAIAALRAEHEEGGAAAERMRRYLAGEHHPQFAQPARAMWMADVDGLPVAYIAGHLSRRLGCDGELQWLYVSAEHRRLGIGTALVGRLAEWCSALRAFRVCVNASAPIAREFYARQGAASLDEHWMVWDDIRVVAP